MRVRGLFFCATKSIVSDILLSMTTTPILPGSLPPPPRQVRTKKDSALTIARLVSLGIYAAWLAMFAYLILVMVWAHYGTNTLGQIVRTHVSQGKKPSYRLEFTYIAPDGPQKDSDDVGR